MFGGVSQGVHANKPLRLTLSKWYSEGMAHRSDMSEIHSDGPVGNYPSSSKMPFGLLVPRLFKTVTIK